MGKNQGPRSWYKSSTVCIVFGFMLLLRPGDSFAQSCEPPTAKAESVQGTVEAKPAGTDQWQIVKLHDSFCAGDTIRVLARSRADISMLDQSVLRLNANATITIEAPKARTGVIDLIRGAVHFFSRGPNSLDVNTRFTVAGARGTEFLVSVEPEQALITVFEGTVVAQNAAGSLTLNSGQSASAQAGRPPVARSVVRPRDAVHWTLYYPPVVNISKDEFSPDILDKLARDVKDPRIHAYRAHHLLAVGSVDEASSEIESALKLAPHDPTVTSLQAIMALAQGDKDRAYEIAQATVRTAPKSATARIALAYTQQARFNLAGARNSILRAVALEPANGLAWARLAELHSSFGDTASAMAAAERAVKIQPELSRTQTVLGFAQLTAIKTRQARVRFEKAITLDQADPLPRLGLGLAKIRDGDLDAGSRQLEIAASLDSANGLVRSYLGKAYFEEKRTPRDAREYEVAKQLDPNDPTPWFYDAIQKQTTNRPVEALADLEQAQALNGNRAVYRSQLLLDSDAASRAAGQARIFSELGFQQRALIEGWQAVNRDPSNFSAHRFLADSYSALPRHKIARVSELLQSQLLAPVTNSPLQPQLGESNLFLVSSGGPAVASFNEYSPLFNRDGASIQLNAMGAGQGTHGLDAIVSGIAGRAAYSVGHTRFRSEGFRANADQNDQITNGFFQFDISPDTSIQAEIRHRENEWGDLKQKFFTDRFSDNLRNTEESDVVRLGARHGLSASSVLLASLIYQERDTQTSFSQPVPAGPIVGTLDGVVLIPEKSAGFEFQHLYRSARLNLRSGIGYVDADRTNDVTTTIDLPFPLPPPAPPGSVAPPEVTQTVTDAGSKHANAYVYGTVKPRDNMSLLLGASYDSIAGQLDSDSKNQFNPKFGLIWNPTPSTTVRAAGFRVLKRSLITDQTLEPTEVAGFNQFFDDANFTESIRYGAAIDHKFSTAAYAGLELSKRELTVPWTCSNPACGTLGPRGADWSEQLHRAYAFWAPHRYWSFSAQYLFEGLNRAPEFTGNAARQLDSHRMPFGIRFAHPSGMSASLTATYWNQRGEFGDNNVFEPGNEKFWTADLAFSYRLPRRMGFLSFGATNLFDKQFRYLDIDEANPTVRPTRTAFFRLSFALP